MGGRIAAGWHLAKPSASKLGGISSGADAPAGGAAGEGTPGPFTERDLETAVVRRA